MGRDIIPTDMTAHMIRRLLPIVLAGCLGVFAVACGGDDSTVEAGLEVTGLITDVTALRLLDLTSLDVRDAAGRTWRFAANRRTTSSSHLSPSHLRDHMVQGLSITVEYHEGDDGALVILDMRD